MPKKDIENNNPHDKLVRQVLSDPRVARDLILHHLPPEITSKVNLEKLVPINKSFIDPKNKDLHSDLILRTTFNNSTGYINFLIEHQSKNDRILPIRFLEYNCALMREHLKTSKTKKLPIILNICLYNGRQPFTSPTSLRSMFEDPKLASELMFDDYHLVDLHSTSQEDLVQNGTAALLELVLKQGIYRDFCNWLRENKKIVRSLFKTIFDNNPYQESILNYIFITESHSEKKLLNLLEEVTEDKDLVMTVGQRMIQRGIDQGVQQGVQQGMQQGIQKEKISVAQNMLKYGADINFIKKTTGLSNKEIESLKESNLI